jgi:hypothetical protein
VPIDTSVNRYLDPNAIWLRVYLFYNTMAIIRHSSEPSINHIVSIYRGKVLHRLYYGEFRTRVESGGV